MDWNSSIAVAEFAVKRAVQNGATYAEAFVQNCVHRSFAIEQGIPVASGSSLSDGIRIRIIKDGTMKVFSTNRVGKAEVQEGLDKAKPFPGAKTELSEESIVNTKWGVEEKVKLESADLTSGLAEIDKSIVGNKKVKYRRLFLSSNVSRSYMINSEGTKIESRVPRLILGQYFMVSNGKESRERFFFSGGTGGYELLDIGKAIEKVSAEITSLYNVIEKGATITAREMEKIKNVVVSPEISGIAAHESIGHPTEADRVFGREAAQAGTSYLDQDNLGLQMGSPKVNIVDDPTSMGSNGYFMYDEEGVRAQPKVLIKEGKQNELLLNREYAHALGIKSNASARSSGYEYEPLIRMSNTYLKPGTATLDELIAEAKEGVYLKSFNEWNIDDTRSFSRYQGNEAYEIKNGKLGKPVKNFVLEKFTFDFWKAVKLVANDFVLKPENCGKGEPSQGMPVTAGGASALLSFM
jgi:TldD protein